MNAYAIRMLAMLALVTASSSSVETSSHARALNPAMAQKEACSQGVMEITESLTLDPACRYGPIRITRSDVVLDCNGATIDLAYGALYGIVIAPPEGLGELRNVVVRNCKIRRAERHGLYVGGIGCDRDKLQHSREQRYCLHPQNILIENVAVELNGNTGLYIDDYVSDVTIRNSRFVRNAGVGIYLEHHSRRTRIQGNSFVENGHGPRYVKFANVHREAIAVDASQYNVIEDNRFDGNYAGGIFLYRNCWEKPEDRCQVDREIGADHNIIRRNNIERSRVGIWIASRQHRSADTPVCGQRPDPSEGIYNDDAKRNRVSDNVIHNVERGIVIEDDHNIVERNTISDAKKACVVVGSQQRMAQFGVPVVGVEVSDNLCRLRPGQTDDAAIAVVKGTGARIDGNRVKP